MSLSTMQQLSDDRALTRNSRFSFYFLNESLNLLF